MNKHLFLFLSLVMFAACGYQNGESASSDMMEAKQANFEAEEDMDQASDEANDIPIERQIIKRAEYRIQVEDVAASTQRVNAAVDAVNGYVSAQELSNTNYSITNFITIRVPKSQFDSLLETIGKDALFTNYRRIYSEDITEEYVDIQTRLKTKKDVRDRYIDLLRNKASNVEEVLKAEEAIRVIQEEIESKEGRLKFLKDRVSMSTIRLEIYQEVEYTPPPRVTNAPSFGKKIIKGLENGWNLILGFILALVNIWPLLLIGGILYWQRKRLFNFRWRRSRKE